MERELDETNTQLQTATTRITELERGLGSANADIASLNITKASLVSVAALADSLGLLNEEKVDKSEFKILSVNVTTLRETTYLAEEEIREELSELAESALNRTHQDQLQDVIDTFASTKANQTDFEDLTSRVSALENNTVVFLQRVASVENTARELQLGIAELTINVVTLAENTSLSLVGKVGQQEFDSLSEQLVNLANVTVDRRQFELLAANLASLRADTSRADEEIWEEIEDLADGTVNRTHHNALQQIVDMFASTKANQSDFEALASEVAKLEHKVTLNVTTIERNVQSLDASLATKAEKQEVSRLSSRITAIEEIDEALESTVESLKTSKAGQSELVQLQGKIASLNTTTAKIKDLSMLNEMVTSHVASATDTHNQLSSDIGDNEDEIENVESRISAAESEIQQLETEVSASSPALVASWMMVVISLSVTLVSVFTSQ
jgi:chromosome segregation ATPase